MEAPEKAAKVGFDWADAQGALDKVKEETAECGEILSAPEEDPRVAEELGDLLFSVVNLCRKRESTRKRPWPEQTESLSGVSTKWNGCLPKTDFLWKKPLRTPWRNAGSRRNPPGNENRGQAIMSMFGSFQAGSYPLA